MTLICLCLHLSVLAVIVMIRHNEGIWAAARQNQQDDLCAQRSHQPGHPPSFHCLLQETLGPWLPTECTVKTLKGLGRCPGWSESSLGAQVILFVLSCCGSFAKHRKIMEVNRFLQNRKHKDISCCKSNNSLQKHLATRVCFLSFFFAPKNCTKPTNDFEHGKSIGEAVFLNTVVWSSPKLEKFGFKKDKFRMRIMSVNRTE